MRHLCRWVRMASSFLEYKMKICWYFSLFFGVFFHFLLFFYICVSGQSECQQWAVCQQRQSVWKQQQQGEQLCVTVQIKLSLSTVYTQISSSSCRKAPHWPELHPNRSSITEPLLLSVSGKRRNIQRDVQEVSETSRSCSDWWGDAAENYLNKDRMVDSLVRSSGLMLTLNRFILSFRTNRLYKRICQAVMIICLKTQRWAQ